MGDYFQTFVDKEASLSEVDDLSQKVLSWLVDKGIVLSTPSNCVLSLEGMGYPPGLNFRDVVEIFIRPDPNHPGKQIMIINNLTPNGLEIIKGRTVFHAGQGGMEVICRQCQTTFDHKSLTTWGDAVDEWYKELGAGVIKCPRCGFEESVVEWQYKPPWGFGNLGFKFWNWPPFLPSFIKELEAQLGHKMVFVYGKS